MYAIKVAELPCKLQCLFSRFLVQSFENFKYLPKYIKSANLFSLVQSNSLQQLTSKDTGAGTQKLNTYIDINFHIHFILLIFNLVNKTKNYTQIESNA